MSHAGHFPAIIQYHLSMLGCRCYEIKCSTGVVVGNYSSTGASIPYNTSLGFQAAVDLFTVKDDYNRTWPGNDLKPQDELFTQCWNLSQASCMHCLALDYLLSALLKILCCMEI